MTSNIGITRAHTNIALIKYWGKENKELFIPMNSSLSLTLEAFYTDTKVELTDALTEDEFYLNGVKQDEAATAKITRFLDLFRAETGDTLRARVESLNFVPTAAGLASSASAFAALAGAMNEATGLRMPAQKLSTYARRGSGSATRSLFGGFVEWNKGDSNENSMAIPVDDANFDIGMIIIVVSAAEKKISSRAGMELTVSTSPFYEGWVTSAATDLADIKQAIKDRDIHRIGSIAEFNGMKMHATMLASNPPFCYFEPESIIAQQTIRTIREERGIPAYFTMDAGPNVKVICKASDIPAIMEELGKVFPSEKLIPTLPGEGIRTLTEDEWNASRAAFEGSERVTITSKAPGKLFIAGEYAVVEPGHGAIVASVSRYLTVTIDEATSVGTLTSTQNPDVIVEWTREEELFHAKEDHPYGLVEEAILVAEQYVRECGTATNALYSLAITSELDDAKRGIKYGLGSSGAVVVATIQAILDFYKTPHTPLLVYKLSVLTNLRLSQRGSFGDIAASSFGGMVYYTSPDRSALLVKLQSNTIKEICDTDWKDLTIERLPEIPNFTLLVGWTGQVAITDSLIQATEKKRKVATDSAFYKEFLGKSHAIVQGLQIAWNKQDIPDLQEGIRANRALLNEFAKVMQLEIETPALQTLCNLAEQIGACAKTSGAGGGDCGICFTQNEQQRQQIENQWAKAQIQVLPLTIAEAW